MKQKIEMQKDPITGIETLIIINEPEPLSEEEKKKNKDFWDEIFESSARHNKRMHLLTNSFWTLDTDNFTKLWDELFKEHFNDKDRTSNDLEKVERDFKVSFLKKIVETCSDKEHKNQILHNYENMLKPWNTQFSNSILITLFWQIDFKETALSLLKNNPCNLSIEQYDYLYSEFCKEFRRNDLPLSITEKDTILENEKTNFLQIQKTYSLFKNLEDKLPEKLFNPKKSKI